MSDAFQQLRHAVTALKTGPFGSALSASEYSEAGVPLINPSDLKGGRIEAGGAVKVPIAVAERMAAYRLREGDVVVGRRGELGRYGLVRAEEAGALCGTGSFLVRPSSRLEPRFLGYLLETSLARDWLSLQSVGSTMDNLSEAILARLPVPAIARATQERIANFLDEQTARIGALIAEKEQLLERLTEYSAAHANEMFGSRLTRRGGVRLKYRCPEVTVGIVVTPAKYYVETGVPCLRSLNVGEGYLIPENLVHISPEANELHAKSKIFAGDIVVVRSGKTGATAVVTADFDGANCIDLVIIRSSKQVDSEWLRVYLNSTPALEQVTDASEGAIQQHFNVGSARELRIPNSPLDEQRKDLAEVLRVERATSGLAAHVKAHVERLREYRASLISAAVTGELDLFSSLRPS